MSSARIIDSSSLPQLAGRSFEAARDPHASDSETASVTTAGRTDKSRKKKKRRAARRANGRSYAASETDEDDTGTVDLDVEIEYVAPPLTIPSDDPAFAEFASVFERFSLPKEGAENGSVFGEPSGEKQETEEEKERKALLSDDDEAKPEEGKEDEQKPAMSKAKIRRLNRLTVAELKQLVKKPEVVEWVDVTAADPKLLVHLKSLRNTVPLPAHWNQKRKYLQGKRGIEKPPFELPDFIKATGIMEMRAATKEKEDAAKLKSKTRERHQPKMNKLNIDYQKMHDAFFKWQTKPYLTTHGDLYYEGKEFEAKLKEKKPGHLSDELKEALGMPPLAPPPWLVNMQRYGPPPSYPNLRIPGLNAPIPDGAQWGFHPGGWGKPPVDEFGRPLYGDVFGMVHVQRNLEHMAPIEKTPWGELEEEEEAEEEEEDEEEEADEGAGDNYSQDGLETPAGLATPSGLASSVPSGLETPEFLELRKDARRAAEDDGPKQLYQVIQERQQDISGFMGSERVYDLGGVKAPTAAIPTSGLLPKAGPGSAASAAALAAAAAMGSGTSKRKAAAGDGVDLAFNPEDLEEGLDEDAIRRKYDESQQASRGEEEDFSDLVAEHAQKQAKRRKTTDEKKDKDKKGKEKFKF
ncbi:hypothetical protein DFJ74DRAFT_672359 [Hyaloraphidium curvatum]|nr:hypothetical protein DFJ74DRAFT_672359 [Hyaloraphidium curvatum]